MTPDPAAIIGLIDAFRASKTMFTAVALGIFDALGEHPSGAAELAPRMGVEAGAVERLLDGCAALGLLRKDGGVYANEPAADAYLRRASPHSLTGYILYSDRILFPLWAHLEDAVREGAPRWKQTFGVAGGIFDGFFKTDEDAREFLRGMHGLGLLSSPRVVEAFDLSAFRHLVDLGGATGHLAMAACERWPQLRATVFDLPRVVALARAGVAASPFRDRLELVAGDFFRDELPAADLYAAGRILHDWPEDRILRLLDRLVRRLPPGGGLLLAEKLLHTGKVGPLEANLQSINMLVCTEGRERSPEEYEALLRRAGFARVAWRRTGAPLDALFATLG